MTETKHEIRVGDEGRGKSLDQARDALLDGPDELDRVRKHEKSRAVASYPLPLRVADAQAMAAHGAAYPDAEIRLSKDKRALEVWSHPKS